jgi:hypothetical protein
VRVPRLPLIAVLAALGTLGLGSATAGAITSVPPPTISSFSFGNTKLVQVFATNPNWTNTGAAVSPTSLWTVTATGQAAWATTSPQFALGPVGGPACATCLLNTAPLGALIGRINNGVTPGLPFLVGAGPVVTPAQTGQLQLIYNDVAGTYGDNLGGFLATVRKL